METNWFELAKEICHPMNNGMNNLPPGVSMRDIDLGEPPIEIDTEAKVCECGMVHVNEGSLCTRCENRRAKAEQDYDQRKEEGL